MSMEKGFYFGIAEGRSMNKGPGTYNEIVEWARKILGDNVQVTKVHILSLTATAERASPPIVVIPVPKDAPVLKTDPIAT